jgi:hypothetical protein
MSSSKNLIAPTIFFIFFLTSCKQTEILPGFKLYNSPNAVDKPGRIYRLSSDNKTDFLVEYLPIHPQPNNIVIPEKEKTKTMNIGSMLSFISTNSSVKANGGFSLNKVSNFKFQLKDAQIYKISDADLRPQYSAMKKRITEDIKLFGLKNPRYFIIRESVTAKEIIIQTSKDLSNNANLTAQLENIIEADANVSWTNSSKNEIKVTLKDGMFVFYKPEEIILQTSAAGDVEISIKPADKETIENLQIGSK